MMQKASASRYAQHAKTGKYWLCTLIIFVFAALAPAAYGQQNSMTININGCPFEMAYVANGSFLMGKEVINQNEFQLAATTFGLNRTLLKTDTSFVDEIPAHAVQLYDFYMGRYEVTQKLWTTVMGYNPSNFKGDDLPVEQVSFFEAQEFIQKLNELTGLSFRLPTEAEWEYAARGGRQSEGLPYAGNDHHEKVAWSNLNSNSSTHPVGSLAPNELGLYDMNGNVWEWCSDWYSPTYYILLFAYHHGPDNADKMSDKSILKWYQDNYSGTVDLRETLNPLGPETGEFKVGRGGSWADESLGLQLYFRNFWVPTAKISNIGFRLALNASQTLTKGWMPNQYIVDSVVAGKVYMSSTTESLQRLSDGELEGIFSVAPDKKIRFSKGNLQYNPVTDSYRLADNQYTSIGMSNVNLSENYEGWIDLFSWGTSGYRDRKPTYSAINASYYGNGNNNIEGTKYDWGQNCTISNGGSKGRWRTLSVNEWAYLLTRRPNANLLMAIVWVENQSGLLILPDDWLQRGFDTLHSNLTYKFSQKEFTEIERGGAVFLPTAGYCQGGSYHITTTVGSQSPHISDPSTELPRVAVFHKFDEVIDPTPIHIDARQSALSSIDGEILTIADMEFWSKVNTPKEIATDNMIGYYWTSTHYDKQTAMVYSFFSDWGGYIAPTKRNIRASVRLVHDIDTQ